MPKGEDLEALVGVTVVVALQLLLAFVSEAKDWTLWSLPWWTWLIVAALETLLAVVIVWRHLALVVVALVGVANVLALVALLGSVLSGQEHEGGQLLFKGVTVWMTNVVAFGIWFWELERGTDGTDFLFPQMTLGEDESKYVPRDWGPRLADYVYVAFTNSIAFSPTDAMPLTRRAKTLMLVGSAVSAITVLLVAARAVNILD